MTGFLRVLRGGGWDEYEEHCRSAYRYSKGPDSRDVDIGFRLVFVPVRRGLKLKSVLPVHVSGSFGYRHLFKETDL